ncbi:hypothetical protein [Microbacterium ulmi]|uniref:Uncharacterized protein n=1 Tax=Microbacterium ulmi TaxID=179095 RepID=A0A7Y2LX81_9MICO|nr:hypothetical protein [Microbacterium ulmi]NII71113.1 hypothetical protein [Microbacterium ulmi]NNH02420.1 hypothetical protein [Microbacterium ulmi]
MTTPEQPGTPPLTRRQLREIRNTGSTPVVTAVVVSDAAPVVVPPPAPLARAAQPVVVPEPPVPDASVDLGVSPLTRRQARQQERIRTASVPVITPDIAAAHLTHAQPIDTVPAATTPSAPVTIDTPAGPRIEDLFGLGTAPVPQFAEPLDDAAPAERLDDAAPAEPEASSQPVDIAPLWPSEPEPVAPLIDTTVDVEPAEEADEASERPIVSPTLGADLLTTDAAHIALPASFDQLISRSSSGSTATPNALIVSQSSGEASIVSPVAATGEVLITGTLNLPEGLGSLGHVPGAADGREVDATLVDGELPAHSSPTPIAASAAISTVKNSGEIIKPPAPEKGNKLMVSLAITAGILAAALLGVLAVAMISGVF